MPLFHIHGLLAGLLAPLSAGGSVACTEGFDAFRFFAQLEALRPTYYTAVPTMHQMVISRSVPPPRHGPGRGSSVRALIVGVAARAGAASSSGSCSARP